MEDGSDPKRQRTDDLPPSADQIPAADAQGVTATLLGIPVELRQYIVDLVPGLESQLSNIMRTCRQLRDENIERAQQAGIDQWHQYLADAIIKVDVDLDPDDRPAICQWILAAEFYLATIPEGLPSVLVELLFRFRKLVRRNVEFIRESTSIGMDNDVPRDWDEGGDGTMWPDDVVKTWETLEKQFPPE